MLFFFTFPSADLANDSKLGRGAKDDEHVRKDGIWR